MSLIIFIGLTAAICTTVAFLPQVVKVLKTKKTGDISLPMYIIMTSGLLLWLTYGLILKDTPLILANAVSFIFAFLVLFLKIKHG